jgi:hypothetical protein
MIDVTRRLGALRIHWVVEWQRRGVPHLHGAIWFPEQVDTTQLVAAWCWIAKEYHPRASAQFILPIFEAVGWFQYVAKHAARGVKHYQRDSQNIPEAWQTGTGRVWGYRGSWVLDEDDKLHLGDRRGDGAWFAFRRLVRSWRIADARASGDVGRIKYARRMLRCSERHVSEVRGFSEWIPRAVAWAMTRNLQDRGYVVRPADQIEA